MLQAILAAATAAQQCAPERCTGGVCCQLLRHAANSSRAAPGQFRYRHPVVLFPRNDFLLGCPWPLAKLVHPAAQRPRAWCRKTGRPRPRLSKMSTSATPPPSLQRFSASMRSGGRQAMEFCPPGCGVRCPRSTGTCGWRAPSAQARHPIGASCSSIASAPSRSTTVNAPSQSSWTAPRGRCSAIP